MSDTIDVLPKMGDRMDTPADEKKSLTDEGSAKGDAFERVEQEADEALKHLEALKKQHHYDPNLPDEAYDELDEALHTNSAKAQINIAHDLLDNSPYPEVRAAVANFDEGGEANTIRAWVIGMVMSTLFSALNAFFSMRDPYIVISSYVAQVVAYPIGVAWARLLPTGRFTLFGHEICLNPGPFNKKEHTVIVLMANATFGGGAAYATDIILAQRAFYNERYGWPFEVFLCISNNMLGFGMAGFFNRFLVQPAAMMWPANLINTAMFSALHDAPKPDPTKTSGWKISRYRLFYITMACSFCWYFFPGFIFQALSVFAFVTFIKPQNVVVNQLFGGWTGLSLIPITFDWTQISGFNFSPLIAPWHGIANTLIGMVCFYWITTIGIHYSGAFYSKYLPISDSNSWDNTGNFYNVSRIINPVTQEFDLAAYEAYSPLFLSTTFMLSYGLSFATILATLGHTGLFHGKDLWFRIKNFNKVEEDIHARLLAKYKQVPFWWYMACFISMLAVTFAITNAYPTHLSWWALIVSLLLGALFFVPIGIIWATTNIGLGLNVLTEFIVGYMQPGRPMAMMLFKAYGYMALYQGLSFAQDMKLGMYMKVPPRITFMAQMIACAWCSVVQIAVINWALGGAIEDICSQTQKNHFSCPNGRVFFNASVIWGAIGPMRIYSPGQIYNGMLWFFIPGLLLPFIFYYLARAFPRSSIKFLNAPIIFGGAGLIPPATPLNYLAWGAVGFVFNKYIRNKYRGWWSFYNYVFSAGLDVGLALCTILIFLTLQLTNVTAPQWWGNVKALDTLDYNYDAIQASPAPGTIFGPSKW